MNNLQGLSAGELATAADITIETLQYYEERGLLPEPPVSSAGYRVYSQTAVERLHFIKGAQTLGFTLGEIRELFELRVDEKATTHDIRQRAEKKLAEVERKISALQAIRIALNNLIEQCHGEGPTAECPILDALPESGLALT